jgi:hypothetical protein
VTLAEIAEAAGVPPRQIRFMIAEGFVPPATGTGRGADGGRLPIPANVLLFYDCLAFPAAKLAE